MADTPARKSDLKPILEQDLGRVALFLHRHMNDRFSAQEWERGLRVSWYQDAPHHGFMLESDGEVVGAICTLYSEQEINGQTRLICNPHTWCVLEPYRGKSVSLILSVIRQKNVHCSMYSPNLAGEEIFAYLGFKPLPRDTRILVNVPTPQLSRKITVDDNVDRAISRLGPKERKCLEDHREFEWLRFLFYSVNERHGFLIYKKCIYKKLPCANLIYSSDKLLFADCWSAIRSELFIKHRIFTTRAEQRLLHEEPGFSFPIGPASAKFYRSETLPPEAFDYTYSELVALDL